MDPHPRKNNPPRRQPKDAGDSGVAPEATPTNPADSGEVKYDPLAAFAEVDEPAPAPPAEVEPVAEADPLAGVYDELGDASEEAAAAAPAGPVATPAQAQVAQVPQVSAPAPLPRTAGAPAPRRMASKRRGRRSDVSFLGVIISLVAIALVILTVLFALPGDFSKVKGYSVAPVETPSTRNLLEEAYQLVANQKGELVLSEADVNAYLGQRFRGSQEGVFKSVLTFRGVFLDFEPNYLTVIIEREIFGQPITMSRRFFIKNFKGETRYFPAGWTMGKFSVNSNYIMQPIDQVYRRLAELGNEEIEVLSRMREIGFEQDKLVLKRG